MDDGRIEPEGDREPRETAGEEGILARGGWLDPGVRPRAGQKNPGRTARDARDLQGPEGRTRQARARMGLPSGRPLDVARAQAGDTGLSRLPYYPGRGRGRRQSALGLRGRGPHKVAERPARRTVRRPRG